MVLLRRPSCIAIAFVAAVGCSGGQGANPNAGAAGNAGGAGAGGSGSPVGGTGGAAGGAAGASGASGVGGTGGATATGGAGGSAGSTATGGVGGAAATGGVGGAAGGGSGGTTPTGGGGGTGGTTSTGGRGGGTGGTAAMGGSGGGTGGTAAMGGSGGTGTAGCTFQIDGAPSAAIATVGIVNWTTDLAGLTGARIEFTLNDPAADELNRGSGGPIDIAGTMHRALMLGLKPARTYTYRIVATDGQRTCTSPDRTLTTGTLASASRLMVVSTRNAQVATAPAHGFIVTTDYNSPAGVYIIDADGDIVWWAAAPPSPARGRMDWEGANMWTLSVNGNQGGTGHVRRISMDGTSVLDRVAELNDAHHDLTVLPGGIVATLLWSGQTTAASDLVERSPDGTVRTVVRIADNVFPRKTEYHSNSVAYHAADDSYVVGDLTAVGYVKLSRAGQPLWQFLGGCASGSATKCASGDTLGNHGHHLLAGSILFFKARMTPSIVYEYSLTETATSLTASPLWSYDPGNNLGSVILGDVQRLPNGNTLIVYSGPGEMRELSPTRALIQTTQAWNTTGTKRALGYADFRPTLYGPPLR